MAKTVSKACDLLEVQLRKGGMAQNKVNIRLLEELLDIGQRQTAMDIFSLAQANSKPYDLLVDLQAQATCSIETDGYALSGLDTTPGAMLHPDAFLRAEATLSSTTQRCLWRSTEHEFRAQNRYRRGSNEYPILYYENAKLYIDVTTGSHPVSVTFNYIRLPKAPVKYATTGYTSANLELGEGLEDYVMRNAYAEALRTAGRLQEYSLMRQEIKADLATLMGISQTSVKLRTEPGVKP